MAQLLNNNNNAGPPSSRLPPRPAFVPYQLRHRVPQQTVPFSSSMRAPQLPVPVPQQQPPPSQRVPSPPRAPTGKPAAPGSLASQQSTLSAQPLLYKNTSGIEKWMSPQTSKPAESVVPAAQRSLPVSSATPMTATPSSTFKSEKNSSNSSVKLEQNPHPVSKSAPVSTQPIESTEMETEASSSNKKKNKNKLPKKVRNIRMAGGMTWDDETLADWDQDDFRLFCGDLGNEVNDDVLTRAFNKYPSFQKARVVRDKRSGKTRGYGFVSFRDSQDYIKAMREMNGKYVGNRPIKLRKSTWKDRNIDVVRKKTKDKVKMGLR